MASSLGAQVVAVQNDREKVLYLGIPTSLTIAVENCPSESVVVTTNNGTIRGYQGHYIISPATDGNCDLQISRKTRMNRLDEIRKVSFTVNRLPATLFFFGRSGDEIPGDAVRVATAPEINYPCLDIEAPM